LLAAGVVGVLLTAFARIWPPISIKLNALEAVSLLNAQRADALAFKAATGRLPTEAARERTARAFGPPHWRDEEIVFPATGRLSQQLVAVEAVQLGFEPALSFRIATATSGAVIWLCGSATAPAGFTAEPVRHTTIPAQYLPHFCRSSTLAP
jgi:hypothetical protein